MDSKAEESAKAVASSDDEATIVGVETGNAKAAAVSETRMSLLQGLRAYPSAVGWSVLVSTSIVMVAYDTVLLNSFYAYPSFRNKYGKFDGKNYQIPASWQSGLSDGGNVGSIMGLLLNGLLVDKFGHKYVMLGALLVLECFIFILFFAPSLPVLEVGEILCGIPFGIFQGLTTAYASEVAPVVLRHYITSYIGICWVVGHFIGAGVLRGLLTREDKLGYKIPFALQWIWPVPLFCGILFAPQSPWWMMRKGRIEGAKNSLRRLNQRSTDEELENTLELMRRTNELEKEIQKGTSYRDCFRRVDLRRTEIAVMVYVIQYLSGNGLSGFSAYFYEQAGLSPKDSFDLTMGQYAIGFFGTLFSWFLMARLGRRTLYLIGLTLSSIVLFTIGFLALANPKDKSVNWATGSMILVHFTIHSCTIGPVLYAIIGETPSTRLRQKTIVVAAACWSVTGLVNASLTPYMLNPSAWDWRGKAGFFWGSFCILSLLWAIFRLPECKGRTFAELDVLFERRVNARKFKRYDVDVFVDEELKHTSRTGETDQ